MDTLTREQLDYIERHGATKNPKTIAKELKLELRRVQSALRDLKDRPPVPASSVAAPDAVASPARSARVQTALACLAIVVLGLLAYANNYSAGWHFDDQPAIINNPALRKATFQSIYEFNLYRQVLNWSFALSYKLHELRPAGWHLENNLIHVANALLVFALVSLSLRAPAARRSVRWPTLVAGLAGVLFVLHPLQTQAVTYVTQRAESLCSTFFLAALTLYAFARVRRTEGRALSRPLEWSAIPAGAAIVATLLAAVVFAGISVKSFLVVTVLALVGGAAGQVYLVTQKKADPFEAALVGGSLVFTLLAMQTKEIAGAIPGAIVLWELAFVPATGPTLRDRVRERALIAPWAAIYAILPILAVRVGLSARLLMSEGLDKNELVHSAASGSEYFLTELNVLATYVRLYVLPYGQHLDWAYPKVTGLFQGPTLLSLAALAASVVAAVVARRRAPAITFAVFFMLGVLVPTSSIFVLPDFIYEHRVYLPLAGATFLTAVVLERGVRRLFRDEAKAQRAYLGLGTGMAVLLLVLTVQRNAVWANEISLWSDSHAKSPNKPRALVNLGIDAQNSEPHELKVRTPAGVEVIGGQLIDGATVGAPDKWLVIPTLAVAPDGSTARLAVPKADVVEGPNERGGLDKAKRHYEAALALDPLYYKAKNNLAMCWISTGALFLRDLDEVDKAEAEIAERQRAGATIDPRTVEAVAQRGAQLEAGALQAFTTAEGLIKQCIEQHPDDFVALNNLANLYHAYLDRLDDAIATMKRSILANPKQPISFAVMGDMHFSRAQERADAGDAAGAKQDYTGAIEAYTAYFEKGADANAEHVRRRLNLSNEGFQKGGVRVVPRQTGTPGAPIGAAQQVQNKQQRWKPRRSQPK
jgi:tetratricopeptide (TPR) repeat protein